MRPPDAPLAVPLEAFDWFGRTLRRVKNPALSEIARQIEQVRSFSVCAAHRDLGSENVFSTARVETKKTRYAVIDWEFFTETAPAMTDRVAFWLGQQHRYLKREFGAWDESIAAGKFLDTFKNTPGGVCAATLALLGLLHIGNDLAERVCGANR